MSVVWVGPRGRGGTHMSGMIVAGPTCQRLGWVLLVRYDGCGSHKSGVGWVLGRVVGPTCQDGVGPTRQELRWVPQVRSRLREVPRVRYDGCGSRMSAVWAGHACQVGVGGGSHMLVLGGS